MLLSLKYCLLFLIWMIFAHSFAQQAPTKYLLFEDDFIDNRHNWLLGDRAKTNAFIENGYFYFTSKRAKYNYSRRAESFVRANQDFEIEIKFRQMSGSNLKGYALEWGGNSLDNTFYEFWLRNDGSYSIDKFDGKSLTFTDFVPWKFSPLVKINDFNILKVIKIKNKISFFINQTKVYDTNIKELYGSEVGFITPPLSTIEVDYLKLHLINSPPESVFPKEQTPNVWVLLVAIADYQNNQDGLRDLVFTVNDAYALQNFYLSPNGGGIPSQNITLLTESKATKSNILTHLKELQQKAQPNDLVVLYLSGHGVAPETADYAFHFLPYDYIPQKLSTAISYQEIQELLEETPANRKLWMIDACHSGGTLPELKGENILEKLSKLKDTDIALLTSSDVGEESLEIGEEVKRGLFSYFLTQGLMEQSKDADINRDGFVSILELFNYTQKKTKDKAIKDYDRSQNPQIGGKFNIQMPLSKVVSSTPTYFEFEDTDDK